MNQIKLLLIGIIFIGTLLFGVGIYLVFNKDKNIQPPPTNAVQVANSTNPAPKTPVPTNQVLILQANQPDWQSVGSGNFTLRATGRIDYGGEEATPDKGMRMGDETALASGIPFGTLIGKIGGNGKPFKVGSMYKFNTTETIYIAINDSYFKDNTGSYTVTIER